MNQESQDRSPEADDGTAATPPAVVDTPPGDAQTPAPARGVGTVLGAVALIGVIAVAAGGYYLWQQMGRLDQSLESKSIALANSESGWQSRSEALSQELDAAREAQQTLQAEIEILRNRDSDSDTDWSVSDVEYLLRIAHHRLMLQQDVSGALAALSAADQRLLEIDDPRLSVVRERIAGDITALRAVPVLDREGMALSLASLAQRVEKLPLASAEARPLPEGQGESAAIEEVEPWRKLLAAVWQEVRQLVVVRRSTEIAGPMLAPEQHYFLQQNLRLQLEAARVALLRGDSPNYSASLETARDWLNNYFDVADAGVKAAREQLQELSAATLNPALPDISGTLGVLRERANQPDSRKEDHEGRAAL